MKRNKYWDKNKNWLDKLEIRFGKHAIPDLMRYMSVLYIVGFLINIYDTINAQELGAGIYDTYLSLDMAMVLKGQVWRLITFILSPPMGYGGPTSILWFALCIYIYLMIARSLEAAWGSFRFNMYYIGGLLFCILAAIISQVLFRTSGIGGETQYMNLAMFFAYAVLYPDHEFLLFFIIPVKVKWLAILDGIFFAFTIISNTYMGIVLATTEIEGVPNNIRLFEAGGYFSIAISALLSIANFLIFFSSTKQYKKFGSKESSRTRKYKQKINAVMSTTRHQCEICKRTEEDNPDLEFRFCSKCDGNHEYCSDHLFTHEHVKKFSIKINKDDL